MSDITNRLRGVEGITETAADEIERLRGLLREVHEKHWPFLTDGLHERVYDAIKGTAVQPPEVPHE